MKIAITATAFGICLVFSYASAMAASGETPQLAPEIEQCIRSNAAKVERAVPNLYEATNFLVNGVCSEPLDKEYQRLLDIQEQKSRASVFKMCEREKESQVTDGKPDEHQMQNPLCTSVGMETMTNSNSTGQDVRAYGMPPHSAAATSLASQLLLDLRLAHMNSKSQ